MSARVAAPVCLVLGVALLFPFEAAFTLALGVAFLLAFIALGTYALTGPQAAEAEDDDGW